MVVKDFSTVKLCDYNKVNYRSYPYEVFVEIDKALKEFGLDIETVDDTDDYFFRVVRRLNK